MVETALAIPVLLLVAIGLVQFALFTHAQSVVIGAVQDGARVGAADGRTVAEGITHAEEVLRAGLGRSASDVHVLGREDGQVVVVEADGRLRTIFAWVGEALLPLRARAVVAKEIFLPGRGGSR